MSESTVERPVRVVGPADGLVLGETGVNTDRFMVDGADTDGRLAVVEHMLGPKVLAAPMHFHTREDEFSYVLEGRVAALLGDQEVVAEAGTLVFKPRGQWHTFWNPGDEPCRILELITPAGLENLFKAIGQGASDALQSIEADYGCAVDDDATKRVIEAYGLSF